MCLSCLLQLIFFVLELQDNQDSSFCLTEDHSRRYDGARRRRKHEQPMYNHTDSNTTY